MGRDIRFRAWHKEWSHRAVDTTDWHKPGQKINGMKMVKAWSLSNTQKQWVHLEDWKSECRLDEVELMQFTGLKDKHGKDIWEGDIVNTESSSNGIVVFKDCAFRVEPFVVNVLDLFSSLEVVGNIHEHLSLLNNKGGE